MFTIILKSPAFIRRVVEKLPQVKALGVEVTISESTGSVRLRGSHQIRNKLWEVLE